LGEIAPFVPTLYLATRLQITPNCSQNNLTTEVTQNKPATKPSVRYMCTMDVPCEPSAKPISPITEPVMQTTRDPYLVIATLTKMPAHISSSSCTKLQLQ